MATQAIEVPKKGPESETALVAKPTPMDLLAIATSQGADIDKLAKLMELQERWEANEARKAFVTAMNAFKANPPHIIKNRDVSFGNTHYSHATLDHVCEQVTKGLSEHGISHRWKVEQADSAIRVTCILTHEMGHSEETTLQGPPDTSGSKNSIQAIGSAVTYLQRYTLLAATGLAAGQRDDDGNGASAPDAPKKFQLPEERYVELRDGIENAGNHEELDRLYKAALAEAKDDDESKRDFSTAKNKAWRRLHK